LINVVRKNDVSETVRAEKTKMSPMSPLSCITLSDLVVATGTFTLTADRLDFSKGQTYLVRGPSGAGKSIFLEVLAGIRRPQRIRVMRNGLPLDIDGFMREAKGFGYLAKNDILFDRTIHENMAYSQATPQAAQLDQWVETVGLVGREFESVRTLSAGEQQRVTLVRETVKAPRVLIIDEGLDSLDVNLRVKALHWMREQLRNSVFIICTHNWEDAIHVDGYISVRNGRVVQQVEERPERKVATQAT
jgi:molybdate/tungstate transport system ATP-binding protein